MSVVTEPIILDETGQDIVTQLQAIVAGLAPNAGQISYSNATSGLSATKVQQAIDEVDGNVDTLSNSLAQNIIIDTTTLGTITVGANERAVFSANIEKNGYTAIGIVGIALSSNYMTVGSFTLINNHATAQVVIWNYYGRASASQTVTVEVLYKKN